MAQGLVVREDVESPPLDVVPEMLDRLVNRQEFTVESGIFDLCLGQLP